MCWTLRLDPWVSARPEVKKETTAERGWLQGAVPRREGQPFFKDEGELLLVAQASMLHRVPQGSVEIPETGTVRDSSGGSIKICPYCQSELDHHSPIGD